MSYITLADAKVYIGGISGTGDDGLIDDLIDSAEAFIESWTNRDFEAAADTTRTFDSARDVTGPVLWFDADICSFTSVTNGDSVAVATDEYTTEPRNETPYYAIRLLSSAGKFWDWDSNSDPEDAISVIGKWGYSTSPPEDIVQACRDIVKITYRSRDGNADTFITGGGVVITPNNVPKMTLKTLNRYKRV